MAKKLPTLFLRIEWIYTIERIRLDLDALTKEPFRRVQTRETWGDGEQVQYRPMASYDLDKKGNHTVHLVYREEDHGHLKNREVFWGESIIRIPRSLHTATVDWVGLEDPMHDVDAHRCSVRIEKPSSKKAGLVKIRSAQAKFKKSLLLIDSECAITGETLRPLLDAAHVHAVEHGGSDEPDNGILLRADLHRLFDAGYFAIEHDGSVTPHADIPTEYNKLLSGKRVQAHIMERIGDYLSRRRHPVPI